MKSELATPPTWLHSKFRKMSKRRRKIGIIRRLRKEFGGRLTDRFRGQRMRDTTPAEIAGALRERFLLSCAGGLVVDARHVYEVINIHSDVASNRLEVEIPNWQWSGK